MADAAYRKPPGEVPTSGRFSPWFVGFIMLLAIASASCSDVWDGEIPSPTATEVAFELNCGENQENPCMLPPAENTCGTDPDDDMCSEDEEGGGTGGDEGSDDGSGDDTDVGNDDEDAGSGSDDSPDPSLEGSVSLTCETVLRGSFGECTLSGTGDVIISNIEWEALTPDQSVTESGASQWGGTMAVTTSMTVRYETNLHGADSLKSAITVASRNWSWAGLIDNRPGEPGEVDQCIWPGDTGVAAGSQCTSPDNSGQLVVPTTPTEGFSVGAGTGPNEGLFFITDPTSHLSMRSQVAPRYRPDGAQHAIQGSAVFMTNCGNGLMSVPMNNDEVNAACPGKAFNEFVTHVWGHENQHLSVAAAEAVRLLNDVHWEWEQLIRTDAASASQDAAQILNQSGDRILSASEDLDAGPMTHSFNIWRHVSGIGFDDVTVQTHD